MQTNSIYLIFSLHVRAISFFSSVEIRMSWWNIKSSYLLAWFSRFTLASWSRAGFFSFHISCGPLFNQWKSIDDSLVCVLLQMLGGKTIELNHELCFFFFVRQTEIVMWIVREKCWYEVTEWKQMLFFHTNRNEAITNQLAKKQHFIGERILDSFSRRHTCTSALNILHHLISSSLELSYVYCELWYITCGILI